MVAKVNGRLAELAFASPLSWRSMQAMHDVVASPGLDLHHWFVERIQFSNENL